MSEENVELVRRAADAFAAEDVEGLVGCADPAIEFEPHLAGVEGNYSGRAGIREFMADAYETLEMRGMDYAEIRDLGDRVWHWAPSTFTEGKAGSRTTFRSRSS